MVKRSQVVTANAKANAKSTAKPAKAAKAAAPKVVAKPKLAPPKAAVKASTKPVAKGNAPTSAKSLPLGVSGKKGALAPVGKTNAKSVAGKAPVIGKGAGSKAIVPALVGKNGKPMVVPVPSKPSGKMPTEPEVIDLRVSRKGPLELGTHKSVSAMAVSVLQGRGDSSGYLIINGRRVRAISTKNIVLPKKSRGSSVAPAAPPTQSQIEEIRTKMPASELTEYRNRLLLKRKSLISMLTGLEDEALRSPGGNLSNMPVHMADMGSDVYEQEFNLGMVASERELLSEIDAALTRIAQETFGICQMTGKPITKARLDAKPWAKYSIEAERIAEANAQR